MNSVNRTLWLPSNWAAGSQPPLDPLALGPPQMPAGAGRHSGDSELLTKIDLACPENFQNYNIPENCARDTHPCPLGAAGDGPQTQLEVSS